MTTKVKGPDLYILLVAGKPE